MKKGIGFILPIFILLIIISFITPDPVAAEYKGFILLTNSRKSLSVCVGQTLNITGEFFSDPLIRGKALAGTLVAWTKLGTISPFKTPVSGIRGPYALSYKADKPGTAQIELTLYDDKLKSSILATETFQIKVKESCQYLLWVKGMLAWMSPPGEIEMQQEFLLLIEETITLTGANPTRYKMESMAFELFHSLPVFHAPGCKNLITSLGQASGTREAVAEPSADGKGIRVGLYDVSIKSKYQAAIGCNFEDEYREIKKMGSFDYAYVGGLDDFWVEGTLPVEGGVINIKKLEPFETYKKNLAPAGPVSYHVIMKLQKLSSK